ncbi:MAG TPA: hypothetical protein VML75_11190 [Kofleriaceae bacterium]|nr:hypothetical protein [Kofleriaceae bacterium]
MSIRFHLRPCCLAVAQIVVLGALLVSLPAPASASTRDAALEQGVALMRDEQWHAMIELLEPLHQADRADDDVALLLAIAYYRADRHDAAAALFDPLSRHTDQEISATAALFLGLIERAGGDEAAAARRFEQVAGSSPLLADSANRLLAGGYERGVSAAVTLRAGADSNVALVSSSALGPGPGRRGAADVDAQLSGALVAQPLDRIALLLVAAGGYRRQVELTELDLGAARAGVRYLTRPSRVAVSLGYAFEAESLGGALFALGHAADLEARIGGRYWLETSYALRHREYHLASYEGYGGVLHRGVIEGGQRERGSSVGLGAIGEYDSTRDTALAGWGAGGRLRGTWRRDRLGLSGSVEAVARWLGARRDWRTELRATASYDIADEASLVFAASGLTNRSTDVMYEHVKLTGHVGMEWRF